MNKIDKMKCQLINGLGITGNSVIYATSGTVL